MNDFNSCLTGPDARDERVAQPFGAIGPETASPRTSTGSHGGDPGARAGAINRLRPDDPDRGRDGRFRTGNRAALVVGERSAAFWAAQAGARAEIERALIEDAGHTLGDASRALRLAVGVIAQAALIQAAAFDRIVESGGPLTVRGRSRRAYQIWLSASERLHRGLQMVGLRRVPRAVSPAEALMAQPVLGGPDADS